MTDILIPLNVLEYARHVLSDPNNWAKTRGHGYCVDRETQSTSVNINKADPAEHCMCLAGAVAYAAHIITGEEVFPPNYLEGLNDLFKIVAPERLETPRRSIVTFNDHPDTTHAEVLELLDKMIDHTAKKVLLAAADLIETKGWTSSDLARDVRGVPCSPTNPAATCFCTLGAIYRVMGLDDYQPDSTTPRAVIRLASAIKGVEVPVDMAESTVFWWNDERHPDDFDRKRHTKADIVAKLREVGSAN